MTILNLFTIFDPSTKYFLTSNYLSIFIIFIIMPFPFWIKPSRMMFSMYFFMWKIFNELMNSKTSFKINYIIIMAMFLTIFCNNLIGLFPYIFSSTSHMSWTLAMSLTYWSSIMMFWLFNFSNKFMTHLTPKNTPMFLMPIMVIIELTSILIRPITLAIRLSANIISGHLLISLLSSYMMNFKFIMFNLIFFIQIMLTILEMCVSIIQAFVFTILITLYKKDI